MRISYPTKLVYLWDALAGIVLFFIVMSVLLFLWWAAAMLLDSVMKRRGR